jgi:ATP-dependent Clp protease ATP-binding subunit ClpA
MSRVAFSEALRLYCGEAASICSRSRSVAVNGLHLLYAMIRDDRGRSPVVMWLAEYGVDIDELRRRTRKEIFLNSRSDAHFIRLFLQRPRNLWIRNKGSAACSMAPELRAAVRRAIGESGRRKTSAEIDTGTIVLELLQAGNGELPKLFRRLSVNPSDLMANLISRME